MTRPTVLGHRGGRGEGWPAENSCEAFARALREGAEGVELDVRLTGDGEVVCFHDPTLARATGSTDGRKIAQLRAADLPRIEGGLRIPSLAEALEVCRGRFVNVEVKSDDAPAFLALTRAVLRVVARDGAGTDVLLSSFDPRVVLAAAALAPRVRRGMLVGDRTAPLAVALPLALRPVLQTAHVDATLLTGARVARLARAGLGVVAWTVNDVARARALARDGVSVLITDRPGELLRGL